MSIIYRHRTLAHTILLLLALFASWFTNGKNCTLVTLRYHLVIVLAHTWIVYIAVTLFLNGSYLSTLGFHALHSCTHHILTLSFVVRPHAFIACHLTGLRRWVTCEVTLELVDCILFRIGFWLLASSLCRIILWTYCFRGELGVWLNFEFEVIIESCLGFSVWKSIDASLCLSLEVLDTIGWVVHLSTLLVLGWITTI